jgi:hypothetical protein
MSLEKSIQKLTNVIQAAAQINTNTTPNSMGPGGQKKPSRRAMSPINPNIPLCRIAHPEGTDNYCICTPYPPGKKCCYKVDLECHCITNMSTPERPNNFPEGQWECDGFKEGISDY